MTAKKKNDRHCVDCIHYKTREVVKSKMNQETDDIRCSSVIAKKLRYRDKVRIFYCVFKRKPLIESPRVSMKLVEDCDKAEGYV